MSPGTAGLEYTVMGFLTAGASLLTLFFRKPDHRRLEILPPGRVVVAYHCFKCRYALLTNEDARDPDDWMKEEGY